MNVTELTIGLLTYYVGTDSIVALLTDQRGQTKRFRLPNCRDVFPLIDHFVAVLEQPVAYTPTELAAAFREFVHGWGRQLLPPAGDLDPFDVLVIVPHHFLHGLPLHIVSQPDGTSLAARYGVTYCSSGTLFARCVDRNRARFPNSAIEAAAGPANGDPAGPGRPPRTCLSLGLDVLTDKDPAYRALAATFASHFQKVQPVTTRDEVKDSLDVFWSLPDDRRPDVICLVSHGYADPAMPDRSGLLIAGRRGVGRMRRVRLHRDSVVRIQDYPFAGVPLRLDPIRPQPVPVGWFDPEPLTISELKVNCSTDAELIALLGCSTGAARWRRPTITRAWPTSG